MNTNKIDVESTIIRIIDVAIKSPGKLKRFLWRYEKDDSEIDDIISQSLLIALNCIHTFKEKSSIESWFFGVCRNTARQHIASKVRLRSDLLQAEDFEQFLANEQDFVGLPLDEQLIQKETMIRIIKTIADLPSDLRYIFEAIYVEGRAYNDVARDLSIPLGTLKSRINRLRKNLIEKKKPQSNEWIASSALARSKMSCG
jgi:RNA polymerase sigma factor (sigma-70 family)